MRVVAIKVARVIWTLEWDKEIVPQCKPGGGTRTFSIIGTVTTCERHEDEHL